MANYKLLVKRGDLQYSLFVQDKEFVLEHIKTLFADAKKFSSVNSFSNEPSAELRAEKTSSSESPVLAEKKPEMPLETNETNLPVNENFENHNEQEEQQAHTLVFDVTMPEEKDNITDNYNEPENQSMADDEPLDNHVEPENQQLTEKESDIEVESVEQPQEEFKEPEVIENVKAPENTLAGGGFDFENILNDKINSPVSEYEVVNEVFDYDSMLKAKQPDSALDYLIITAYYLLENEKMTSFQLKQLNSRLFSSMKMVVDRKTVQKAIEEGLLMVVSDLSDDGIVEYALTPTGREMYLNGYS